MLSLDLEFSVKSVRLGSTGNSGLLQPANVNP